MKENEIMDKYKDICQFLFLESNDDDVLRGKAYVKIANSAYTLSHMIFNAEDLLLDDLYIILDMMTSTMKHCIRMFPRTYDRSAVVLTIAILNVTRDLFENESLQSVPIRELMDKDVVIELVNDRLDTIIDLFNHDGPLDDSYLNEVGYNLGKNTIDILYKALKEKHTIHEHINIDISHRHDET